MRKIFLLVAVAFAGMMQAHTVTLNVAAPLNPETIEYDEAGVWAETYNEDDYETIDYQSMSFFHQAFADWNFWDGFTIAKSEDTTFSVMSDQFRCVAGGGLAGKGTPYLLAYAAEGMGPVSDCQVYFDGTYTPKEVYLCIGSWALENVLHGGTPARAFAAGDSLVVEIEGLDENYDVIEGKKVTFFLADYRSQKAADWKLNNGWEKCDLTALGKVNGLIFTMKTSDAAGGWSNTALYFALDGLSIVEPLKVATFEDVTIAEPESVLHLSATGDVKSGDYYFTQDVADYGSWGVYYFGNLPSNKSDNTYASIADAEKSASGGAYEGANFNVWTNSYSGIDGVTLERANVVPGFFINNTAWVVDAILHGDGMSSDDAAPFSADDYFTLTITATLNGVAVNNEVKVDLAAEGKYINQWTYVDLSSLGEIDALHFALTGSKHNNDGMTTPAYFAIDNFGADMPKDYVEPEKAVIDNTGTGIDNTNAEMKAMKVLRNGQVIIIRGEKKFNILGAEF